MKIICSINLDIRNKFIIIVQDYGKQKKQLLDTMKALPMTMEDKCAFVDLVSQNSNGGGTSQEDEYFYFDIRGVNLGDLYEILPFFPYFIVDMDNKVLELPAMVFSIDFDGLHKTPIAIKVKKYIILLSDADISYPGVDMKYYKVDTIAYMNYIGVKQITKEEYESFITFTIDDFEEVPLG